MELFDKALMYAIEQHSGQRRKTSDLPYIMHPLEVATIVGTMTDSQETLAAAVLHDTVEDANATLEEIAKLFGKRVSLIVMTETENKREELPPEQTWRLRKEETLSMLENTKDDAVKMLWLGDKLSNMRSFYRQYLEQGDSLWQSFNQKDPAKQAWYYRTIAKCLYSLHNFPAYQEYTMLVDKVFENVKEDIYGL